MAIEVIMPRIDEDMTEGRFVEWLKQEGDQVNKGELLFVIETEKITIEIESPASGILAGIHCHPGDIAAVGTILAHIIQPGEKVQEKPTSSRGIMSDSLAPAVNHVPQTVSTSVKKVTKASPIARRLAKDHGMDIAQIDGSGPNGRITKNDILNAIELKPTLTQQNGFKPKGVPISTIRKTIARRMAQSFQTVPHFYLSVEASVEELNSLRGELIPVIQRKTGIRLTYTDILIKIIAKALSEFPEVNCYWQDDEILQREEINIGFAVAVPEGLLVPNIKATDKRSIEEITQVRFDLVERAKSGKLLPADMKSGSFTLTNLGMFDIDQFHAIINPPESCILSVGRIYEKAAVKQGTIVIQKTLNLTLSVDHRVLDGVSASKFLKRVHKLIERPNKMIKADVKDKNQQAEMREKCLVAVIGGGPGGYTAAIEAARLGAQVTLIEKNTLGGTCLNRGCIPTKLLLETANLTWKIEHAQEFGLSIENLRLDFETVVSRKDRIVKRLVKSVDYLMKKHKVKIINGEGRLVTPRQIVVNDGANGTIEADKIIIATGSITANISIQGMNNHLVMDSDSALSLRNLPVSIVIIGGGYVGVEFAQIFKRMNVAVTLIEKMPHILPAEDPDIAGMLQRALVKDGIEIHVGADVNQATADQAGSKTVYFSINGKEKEVTAEHLLVATGRKPNVESLDLNKLGIAANGNAIQVNGRMETSIGGIYAIGDVIGGSMLAHVAMAEGRCAAMNAMGRVSEMNYNAIPRCVYSSPEVASVGLTEAIARERYGDVKMIKLPFTSNGKALISGNNDGVVKLIAHPDNDILLGGAILGPHATEMITEITAAVQNRTILAEMASIIHPHPTLSETIMDTALMGFR